MNRTTKTRIPLLAAAMLASLPPCGSAGGLAAPAGPIAGGAAITSAGGSVAGLGGAATLTVPAHAVAAAVTLTATEETTAPLDPAVVAGTAVRFAPAVTFAAAAPAALTIRYDPARRPSGVAESDLRVHQLVDGAWLPMGGSIDTSAHVARVLVTGTGAYAVRWPEPVAPCESREAAQFDFWVGHWSFSAPNAAPGTNDVTRESAGCLIQERFRDAHGTVGRSISLLSPLDGRWHQTYVDSVGGRLVLVGGFEDGRMRLYETVARRFSWLRETPDRVRYFEERTADGGATWTVPFDAVYARR